MNLNTKKLFLGLGLSLVTSASWAGEELPRSEIRLSTTEGFIRTIDGKTTFNAIVGGAFAANEDLQFGGSLYSREAENFSQLDLMVGPVFNFAHGNEGIRSAAYVGAELGVSYQNRSKDKISDMQVGGRLFGGKRFPITSSVAYAPEVEAFKYHKSEYRKAVDSEVVVRFIAFQAHF
jgi:hypothetical protein